MKVIARHILLLMLWSAMINAQAQDTATKPFVSVEGEVTQPLKLYVSDLESMTRTTKNFKGHDSTAHSYTGVPVSEILLRAGVTMGKQLRGKNLSKYLLVVAADGYKVVFSLAELDSNFTDKQIILAYKRDGKLLPAELGPFQLIVADEKRPARSCFKVTSMFIRIAKED